MGVEQPVRRLYLDASDLIRIADGDVAEHIVQALRESMHSTGTMLLITRELIQDMLSAVDAGTTERVIRALELFSPVLVVLEGPYEVEPLSGNRMDIVTGECVNIREVILSDAAKKWMESANRLQDAIHGGDRAAAARLTAAPTPVRIGGRAAQELYWSSAITFVRGWLSDDAEDLWSFWEGQLGHDVSQKQRGAALAGVQATILGLQPVLEFAHENGVDPTDAPRLYARSLQEPEQYPGLTLAAHVSAAKFRDVKRKRKRSDWLDLEHVMHFPYVDICTCDANTFSCLAQIPLGSDLSRSPEILQSGNMESVIDSVRKFMRGTPS